MRDPATQARTPGALTYGLAASAVQAAFALLASSSKLLRGTEDTDVYFKYANLAFSGKIPYRDFTVEYPPLALPLFLLPRMVATGRVGFKFAFAAEMLLVHSALTLLVAVYVRRREGLEKVPARLAWFVLISLILSRFLVARFDAAPAFLGFLATVCWISGRSGVGGFLASLGTLLKVYPAVLAMISGVRDWTRLGPIFGRAKGLVAFGLTSLVGAGAWLILGGGHGVGESLRYHSGRGFEYGSVYSGAQMLAAKLLGAEIGIARDHVSFSTTTPWSRAMLPWAFPIQAGLVLMVGVVFARRGARDVVRYSGAAILAFILGGKVFSPQYLIWMMPYIAVLGGPIAPRARRLFAAVSASTLLAPALLGPLSRTSPWVILAYDARNVLAFWLLALLVFGPPGRPDVDRPR